MSYETDFITGRAITKQDRAVALVIIPTVGGYPDAVKFAAKAPVYPHDRFVPLSLLLHGRIAQEGFVPDEGQIALDIFEDLAKMSWASFRATVLDKHEGRMKVGRFKLDEERVAPGLAIMHKATADQLISLARQDLDAQAAARAATVITIDAKLRASAGDGRYWLVSQMLPPAGNTYETLSGEEIAIPNVSYALADMEPQLLSHFAKFELHRHHDKAELSDGTKLLDIYTALVDLQKLNYGMRMMSCYLQPSAISRGDNLTIVARFNIEAVTAALTGYSDRFGFEDETGHATEQLASIADALKLAMETVESEMAKRSTYEM